MKGFIVSLLAVMVLLFIAVPVMACEQCRDGPVMSVSLDAVIGQVLDNAVERTDEVLLLNTNQEDFTLDSATIKELVPISVHMSAEDFKIMLRSKMLENRKAIVPRARDVGKNTMFFSENVTLTGNVFVAGNIDNGVNALRRYSIQLT